MELTPSTLVLLLSLSPLVRDVGGSPCLTWCPGLFPSGGEAEADRTHAKRKENTAGGVLPLSRETRVFLQGMSAAVGCPKMCTIQLVKKMSSVILLIELG